MESADDRHCQTPCLLHCVPGLLGKPRLGETIRGNRGANHTVRLSKKGTAPATRGVFAQNLGRANCHTRVADRYTAHCTCHRREENDPRR
jgi:hypothetical protein